ncbi:MAG: hypothetical protein IKR04_03410 [Clostridia bacterium]|nr:hypothetical protein [Clostridia bacterium]
MSIKKRLFIIALAAILLVSSSAMADALIAARKWRLTMVKVDFVNNQFSSENGAIVKENTIKTPYKLDNPHPAYDKAVMLPLDPTMLNSVSIVERQAGDYPSEFQTAEEALESTFGYADAAGRLLPELDGLTPSEAYAQGARFTFHKLWYKNAAKVCKVTDKVKAYGGAKYRVAYVEEVIQVTSEDDQTDFITIRHYGLLEGWGEKKESKVTPKPSGDPTPTPKPEDPTPTPEDPTPTPKPEDPTPTPEDPTPTPKPEDPTPTPKPHPEEDDIILPPKVTETPTKAPDETKPDPHEDDIVLPPKANGSVPTTDASASTTTTTVTETKVEVTAGGNDSDSGKPNNQEDEITLPVRNQ